MHSRVFAGEKCLSFAIKPKATYFYRNVFNMIFPAWVAVYKHRQYISHSRLTSSLSSLSYITNFGLSTSLF